MRTALNAAGRRWWLVLLTTLLGAGIGYAAASTMPATYTGESRVFVAAPEAESDLRATQLPERVLQSYADAVSGEIARRTEQALGLDAALGDRLHATVVPGTQTIRISADADNADGATTIAREATEQLITWLGSQQPEDDQLALRPVVAAEAAAGSSPSSPDLPLWVVLGGIAGLLLGLLLAWQRESVSQPVSSAEDAEDDTGAAVLGAIGFDRGAARDPLITSLGSHHPRFEAIRILRTNLQFLDVDRRHKIVTVTSSLPGEGKSTTACNLGIAIAQAGRSVVLVEGDLRRPRLAEYLGLEKSVGVTTVLVGRVPLDSALQQSQVPGLDVLTSGSLPPNPSEILQTEAMAALLAELRERYDVVLIDAPPLLPVTDAALLAAASDGALVLTRHGHTGRDQLRSSVDRLRAVNARVLGTVLTMTPKREVKRYGYGYGYGYGPEYFARQTATARQRGGSRRAR